MKQAGTILMSAALLAAAVIVVGCGREPEGTPPPAPSGPEDAPALDEQGEQGDGASALPPAAPEPEASPAATGKAQTACPVMGNPIDKSIFVDHNGKRVYFCCSSCMTSFKQDPEKYISKLTAQGIVLEDAPQQ